MEMRSEIMFKKLRAIRYKRLISVGFRSWEARWLSMIPIEGHPAIKTIMRKRKTLQEKRTREADKKGWSLAERQKVWEARTQNMYRRQHWISQSDHPTGQGPRAGEANPFQLYRLYERNYCDSLPGESRKSRSSIGNSETRWELDKAQVLLFKAKKAAKRGNRAEFMSWVKELDVMIVGAPRGKQEHLAKVRAKLARSF
jgi:hypothetical protein